MCIVIYREILLQYDTVTVKSTRLLKRMIYYWKYHHVTFDSFLVCKDGEKFRTSMSSFKETEIAFAELRLRHVNSLNGKGLQIKHSCSKTTHMSRTSYHANFLTFYN